MNISIIVILLFVLNAHCNVKPCSTLACDREAVQKILESNGLLKADIDEYAVAEDKYFLPGQKKRITKLSLRNQGLTILPPELGKLTGLRDLWLDANQLKTLPNEIGNAINLSILQLNKNKLTELPVEIGNLTNLLRLDLTDNFLTELPGSITKLSIKAFLRGSLVPNVHINNNRLCSLPDSIEKWLDDNNWYAGPDWRDHQTIDGINSCNSGNRVQPQNQIENLQSLIKISIFENYITLTLFSDASGVFIYNSRGTLVSKISNLKSGSTWNFRDLKTGAHYLQVFFKNQKSIVKKVMM